MTDTITPWQDRTPAGQYLAGIDRLQEVMQAEIDELRAAIAQQAEPAIKFKHGCQWCGKQNCTTHTQVAQQAEQVHTNVKSSAGLIRNGKVDDFMESYFTAAPKGGV